MRIVADESYDQIISVDDIETFEKDDVYLRHDVLFQPDLDQLVKQKGTPRVIVDDHAVKYDMPGYSVFAAPLWTLRHNINLKKNLILCAPEKIQTQYAFNFMINKKKINRYLLIKFVEFFNLKNFTYTWSGTGNVFDLADFFNELENMSCAQELLYNHLRCFLCKPIMLEPKWIGHNTPAALDDSRVRHYGNNISSWNQGLKEIFSDSAVSLISESIAFEKASVITEKTLYSMYGLTFPIFIGGYGHCAAMQDLGFDMFVDVFDHSYQYKPTLFERCYQAFRMNYHLLADFDRLCFLRQQMMDRLISNREKLLSDHFSNSISDHIKRIWPDYLIQHLDVLEIPARVRERT